MLRRHSLIDFVRMPGSRHPGGMVIRMPLPHPKAPRPDSGRYRAWLNSWALAMRSDGLSKRTVDMYVDAAELCSPGG